jgi:hypothetical protein
VRPGIVGLDICSVRESVINCVERDNKIIVVVYLLESADNALLTPDSPDKVLMCRCVVQKHALFVDHRQLVWVDGRWILSVISKTAIQSKLEIKL